jgi:hypothetical protein
MYILCNLPLIGEENNDHLFKLLMKYFLLHIQRRHGID